MVLGLTQPLTKMSNRNLPWRSRWPVRMADNLAILTCRLSENPGNLNLLQPSQPKPTQQKYLSYLIFHLRLTQYAYIHIAPSNINNRWVLNVYQDTNDNKFSKWPPITSNHARTVTPFQMSQKTSERFDRHKKCICEVPLHLQLKLNSLGNFKCPHRQKSKRPSSGEREGCTSKTVFADEQWYEFLIPCFGEGKLSLSYKCTGLLTSATGWKRKCS